MEMNCQDSPARQFLTPPCGNSKRWSPMSEKKWSSPQAKRDLFHVIHKVPAGDSPYVRAKHVQLIDKDPSKAISLFWAAINSGDRVDSALKDMAVVMKQLNRADEAIEAIKSFRHLCPAESQESLDNVLVELYKRSGRIEDQIEMLELKVKSIEEGIAFGGKRIKSSRSQGKKILITIEQEYSRLLGNLAWAYLQNNNYKSAEELYRKALSLEQDKNKQCNLAICLMHMNRMTEARFLLQTIRNTCDDGNDYESFAKSYERATQVLAELELQKAGKTGALKELSQIKGTGSNLSFPTSINLKFGSFGTEDSPDTSSGDRFQKGSYHEASFSCRKQYSPLVPGKAISRVPYTQPKRAPSSFIGRDQRSGAVLGNCSRKLLFEQPPACERLQLAATQNRDGQSCIGGDWRKKSLEDHSILNRNSNLNEAKSSSGTSADQGNLTIKGRDLATKATDSDKCVGRNEENRKTVQSQSCQNSSCESKRTWADMVEEEEQELLSRRPDEEFADENVNSSNITPSEKLENLSQKLLLACDMRDGYCTQPKEEDRVVRRSLCFREGDKSFCSPLRNVALNFEGHHRSSREEEEVDTKQLRRNRLQVFRDITP